MNTNINQIGKHLNSGNEFEIRIDATKGETFAFTSAECYGNENQGVGEVKTIFGKTYNFIVFDGNAYNRFKQTWFK
jgi:uncharacterized Ntn-hydrolase superfamily protein